MAIFNDFIEVTSITANTTYSTANGSILGVVDGADKDPNFLDPDNEFNIGDTITIGGTVYSITDIDEPTSNGTFNLFGGGTSTFGAGSEANLDVMFLTVSNGVETRFFIIPNDSYGDMAIDSITVGGIGNVAGSDALITASANDVVTVCFAAGTQILTENGNEVSVEDLKQGDLVQTVDNGLQPIRWIGAKKITEGQQSANPNLRPIRIRAGALGNGTPKKDLVVSPQHRVLVRSAIAQRMFGESEVLVAAKHLCELDGIEGIEASPNGVIYVHFLFDQHEVVFANGAETESLYTGPEALKSLAPEARQEIMTLFPEVSEIDYKALSARPLVSGRKGRNLATRHQRNSKDLVHH